MNPKNVKDFFDKFEEGNIGAIIKRFNLEDGNIVASMRGYLNYIIEGWLNFKEISGTYEYNALSQLIAKSMTLSMKQLEDILPFELTSRYLATYNLINKKDCNSYFSAIVEDEAKRNSIC
jgi:hypothetical protein